MAAAGGGLLIVIGMAIFLGGMTAMMQPGPMPHPGLGGPEIPIRQLLLGMGLAGAGGIVVKLGLGAGILGLLGELVSGNRKDSR